MKNISKYKLFLLIIIVLLLIKLVFYKGSLFSGKDYYDPSTLNQFLFSGSEINYPGRISAKPDSQNFAESFELKQHSPDYEFRLLHVILYDSKYESYIDTETFQIRLEQLSRIFYRESLGKINFSTELVFLDIKNIGLKELDYSKYEVYQWLHILDDYYKFHKDYNVLIFSPVADMSWCDDSHSIGYNIRDKIMICQEYSSPYSDEENRRFIALAAHKISHGMGYNHIDQDNVQMIIMDWYMGLPETNGLPFSSFSRFPGLFFNKHFYQVLELIPSQVTEFPCLDSNGFICKKKNVKYCENAWGAYCSDSDRDGISDEDDDYFLTPPGSKTNQDEDSDGIPDDLDLCPWNDIVLTGNLDEDKFISVIDAGKQELTIKSSLNITQVEILPLKNNNGFWYFSEDDSRNFDETVFQINAYGNNFWRVRIHYVHEGKEYAKPIYLATDSMSHINYFYEDEWYYFNRFGCDVPLAIDLKKRSSYDLDYDGFPDSDKFDFVSKIDNRYDWDGDGVADRSDTLPTVTGTCAYDDVVGVPDSDEDGLCDPGHLNFKRKFSEDLHVLSQSVSYKGNYDWCPYLSGTENNKGCPALNAAGEDWYISLCPLDDATCFSH